MIIMLPSSLHKLNNQPMMVTEEDATATRKNAMAQYRGK
jgi:hypothetical protein